MTEIKLPEMRPIDNDVLIIRKLSKSARAADLYLRLCHKVRAKQSRITTRDIASMTGMDRGAAYLMMDQFATLGLVKKHKSGTNTAWLLGPTTGGLIVEEYVNVASRWITKGEKK